MQRLILLLPHEREFEFLFIKIRKEIEKNIVELNSLQLNEPLSYWKVD
jgi:hypothetical protein